MHSGYKTITPIQLANAFFLLDEGKITHQDLRVYLACFVMVAVREAAARSARKIRRPYKTVPRYTINELDRITGISEAKIRSSLRALSQAGLIEYAQNHIEITKTPLPGSEDLLESIAGNRSPKRPIPVPRSLLRFLARNRKVALTKTAFAYVVRGLSLSRTGNISQKGTVKISWIAETFNLSERAVKYARSELVELGWIDRDRDSHQFKLNRDGAYFIINLDWKYPAANVQRDKSLAIFAPLPSKNCMVFAPPYKDKKTSIEFKNQKTHGAEPVRPGVYVKEGQHATEKVAPMLTRLCREDFYQFGRLESIYFQAVQAGWVRASESMALNFIAAAVRAREVGRDPPRVFVTLVRRGLWHHITQAQEDRARKALNRYREIDPQRFRLNPDAPYRMAA